MTPRAREVETLLLTMLAAVPLYFTNTISSMAVGVFHLVMAGIVVHVAIGRGPELIPARVMRVLAGAYFVFYAIDFFLISRSAIAASTHLVLFIATYQPIESVRTNNYAQRLLTTTLIFTASIASSTHISVVLFVVFFGFVMFRQLMYVSHVETVRSVAHEYQEPPSGRAAAFYLAGTACVAAMLFPIVPRVRSPLVQGFASAIANTATGLSESIDFSQGRTISPDSTIVSRVWISQDALPFFTPLRLRGAVYSRYLGNQWRQLPRYNRQLHAKNGTVTIAAPIGFQREVRIQQRLTQGTRLYLPPNTFAVSGLRYVTEMPTRGSYAVALNSDRANYGATLAREVAPLTDEQPQVVNYPITSEVAAFAKTVVGDARDPMVKAQRIERYLSTRFTYVQDPSKLASIGQKVSVDDFLLRVHRGHCEYFAAGMVALLTSLDVPARIAGGFYGGQLNPLVGCITVRREDAHAWVEAWDGSKWVTFDPTPAVMRPGGQQPGLFELYLSATSDAVNYFWDRYILTYGLGDQIALFSDMMTIGKERFLALKSRVREAVASISWRGVAGVLVLLLLLGGVVVFILRLRRSPYALLEAHLHKRGIEVGPSMTMEEALAVLRTREAAAAHDLDPLIRLYEEDRFSARDDRRRRSQIRRGLGLLQG